MYDMQETLLSKQDMLRLLEELNDEAVKYDFYAVLDVYGGSAIALGYIDSRKSMDIDAVYITNSHKSLRRATDTIAKRHSLSSDWINEAIMSLVMNDLRYNDVAIKLNSMSNIEIRIPSAEQLLAMKLYAGRDKDIDDAVELAGMTGLTSRRQLIDLIHKYFNKKAISRKAIENKDKDIYWAIDEVIEACNDT
jgi:hypothetical protein